MYKFKRPVYDMRKGKQHRAGSVVPGDFSTPAGLAEMLKAGDIELVVEGQPEAEQAEQAPKPRNKRG